jgi:hypothetical protein
VSDHSKDADQPSAPALMKTFWTKTYVDLLDPKQDQIHLIDIAYGLSHLCRFTGQVPAPYSVAEHCLVVSNLVERWGGTREQQLAAVLHDATEAYLTDVNGMLKKTPVFDGYRHLERSWERAIEAKFGLPLMALADILVKKADKEAFNMECSMVRDAPWREPVSPAVIREAFTTRVRSLQRD